MKTLHPPPSRPRQAPAPTAADPEALIEEARTRARRRRALYGLAAVVVAGAVAGFWWFNGAGTVERATSPRSTSAGPQRGRPILARNGPLTIIVDTGDGFAIDSVGPARPVRTVFRCGREACGELESVAWSPDGKTLAYGAGSVVTHHPQDGLHFVSVSSGGRRQFGSGGDWFDLAWSPDGRKLAYVSDGTILVMRPGRPQSDSVPLPIAGQGVLDVKSGVNASPTWSPDSRQIAYASTPRGEQSSAIYVVGVDGAHLRRVAVHGYAPAWSPDGTRIAYSVRSGIRLVTPSGRDVTPPSFRGSAHVGIAGSPAWSPDGRKIAVATRAGTIVMNRDGTHLQLVWAGDGEVATFGLWRSRPAWRPVPR